jgi:DNA (cytosine-5)-methyltransferase 1
MKAISLFSGAGGDTLGMELMGIDVVGFVELNKTFCETHLMNLPNCELIGNDIRKLDLNLLEKYNDIDIVFFGMPCQSFSYAGKRNKDDPRGKLFYDTIKVINKIKPKWIIGENVQGLLTMTNKENELVKEIIISEFSKIGYFLKQPFLVDCSKYSLPQKRKRCFFIGSTSTFELKMLSISNETGIETFMEKTLENAIEIKDTFGIEKFVDIDDNIEITGKPATNLIKCLTEKKLSFGKRISPTHSEILDIRKPCKTIICTYNRMPRLFVPLKNSTKMFLRELTITELQRIQGFPKEYIFTGNKNEKITQIGNAVPPLIVTKIIKELILT